MIRKLPIIPTLLVLVAVGIMVRLGFWQLDRLHQKEAMLARYEQAMEAPRSYFDLNKDRLLDYPDFFGHARVTCASSSGEKIESGRNAAGNAGWAHVFRCTYAVAGGGPGTVSIVGGWSGNPSSVKWSGGQVSGVIVPESMTERWKWHIVADPPLAGLQPNAKPDPATIPNNHLAYAVQWFLFAGVALVIYVLALRKRARAG